MTIFLKFILIINDAILLVAVDSDTSFDHFINLKILRSSLSEMLRCAYVCMFIVVSVAV